ncbi:MAG: hypothetical protein WA931_14535 [Rhodococcus sp. (in: high G+C Gram-positive bacteria)]
MGLRELLAARAVRVAHVLVVEVPGAARTRIAAENEINRRGWQLATSPADADLLLTCGAPGTQLESVLTRVWDQMPGPRARVTALSSDEVAGAIDSAKSELLDDRTQRGDAGERSTEAPDLDDTHGEMDMAPGGIALADDGADTDGLHLDVLHIPLGPVMPHWPAGLVLDCTVQGDLIMGAQSRWIDTDRLATDTDDADPRWFAALRCDAVARLLGVAGWDAAADKARRIRDGVVDGDAADLCTERMQRLATRVSRNRILRWSLRGITVPGDDGAAVEVHDLPAHWLASAAAALGGAATETTASFDAEELGSLVTCLDLATARTVVAALAPRLSVMSDA